MFGTKVGDVFYGPSGIVVYLVYGAFSQLSGLYSPMMKAFYWLSCELLSKISKMIMHVLGAFSQLSGLYKSQSNDEGLLLAVM